MQQLFSLQDYRQICGRQYLHPVLGTGYNRSATDQDCPTDVRGFCSNENYTPCKLIVLWALFNAYSGYEV